MKNNFNKEQENNNLTTTNKIDVTTEISNFDYNNENIDSSNNNIEEKSNYFQNRYKSTNFFNNMYNNNKINEESDSDLDEDDLSSLSNKNSLSKSKKNKENEINKNKKNRVNLDLDDNFMLDNDNKSESVIINKLKIFFIIPESKFSKLELEELKNETNSLVNKKEKESPMICNKKINVSTTTYKNGYVIRDISVNINSDKSVNDLILMALYKINYQLNKEDIMLRFNDEENEYYSLRTSKKSGLPDFDMPSKFLRNYINFIYFNITLKFLIKLLKLKICI